MLIVVLYLLFWYIDKLCSYAESCYALNPLFPGQKLGLISYWTY